MDRVRSAHPAARGHDRGRCCCTRGFEFDVDGKTFRPNLVDVQVIAASGVILSDEFDQAVASLTPAQSTVVMRQASDESATSGGPVELILADGRSLSIELTRLGLAVPVPNSSDELVTAADEARAVQAGLYSAVPNCTAPGQLRRAVAFLSAASGSSVPSSHACSPDAVAGAVMEVSTETTFPSSSSESAPSRSSAAPTTAAADPAPVSPSDVARLGQLEEWHTSAMTLRTTLADGVGFGLSALDANGLTSCLLWLQTLTDESEKYLTLLRQTRDDNRAAEAAEAVTAAVAAADALSDKERADAQTAHEAALLAAATQHETDLQAAVAAAAQQATDQANAAAQVKIDEAEQRAAAAEASAQSAGSASSGSSSSGSSGSSSSGSGSSGSGSSGSSSSGSGSSGGSSGYTGRRCYAPGGQS